MSVTLLPSETPRSPVGVAKPRPLSDSALLEHSHSYVQPELLSSWPLKCAYVVNEILKTESDYLTALESVIKGYKNPLAGRLMTNKGQEMIRTIFCNMEDLYSLHKLLLEQLKERESDPHGFGRVFSDSEQKFHMYSDYCINYEAALEMLTQLRQNKDSEGFILSCQRKLGHPLPLSSQLIKPVQRIMRYHMLLHEVVKKFDPNLYGHASLCHAHKTMSRIADHVNEVKKLKENAKRAEDIQNCLTGWSSNLSAYGQLILESPCRVGKRGAERQVILFKKLLLILKKKDVKRYNYKAHILTEELCIDKDSTSKPSPTFKVFSRAHSSHTYVIATENTTVQAQWVREITGLLASLAALKRQEEAELRKYTKQDGTSSRGGRQARHTIHESPHSRYGSTQSKRLIGPRKRQRPDVRDAFPEEDGVKLVSVKAVSTASPAHPTRTVSDPQSSLKYVRLSGQSDLENDPNLSNAFPQREMKASKSSDSVVSLGDVEVGVADVEEAGREGREEVDSPSPPGSITSDTPVRRASMLKRKAAIKVKKSSVTPDSSFQSIIRIRAREARKSASLEPQEDEEMEPGQYSDEEGSELVHIIGSPQTSLHRSESPVHETSQCMEYDSLYQSGGLESGLVAGGPPPLSGPAANGGYQVEIDQLSPADETLAYSESGRVYDSGLGELEGSLQQGEGQEGEFPSYKGREGGDRDEGVSGVEGVGGDDIVILEDSSDSEDDGEDEDSFEELPSPLDPTSLVSMETYPEGIIPPPGQFESQENGEQEGSQGPPEVNQSLSSGELTSFFQSLRKGESPSSHDQSRDSPEQRAKDPAVGDASSSVQFNGRQSETIYATLPRKPHSKSGSSLASDQMTPPPGTHPSDPRNLSYSTQTLSRSAARRADGFSRLLEFTRQQRPEMSPARQLSAPGGGYEVTQSLPLGRVSTSRSLDGILESVPCEGDEGELPVEASVDREAGEPREAQMDDKSEPGEPCGAREDKTSEAGEAGEPCEAQMDDKSEPGEPCGAREDKTSVDREAGEPCEAQMDDKSEPEEPCGAREDKTSEAGEAGEPCEAQMDDKSEPGEPCGAREDETSEAGEAGEPCEAQMDDKSEPEEPCGAREDETSEAGEAGEPCEATETREKPSAGEDEQVVPPVLSGESPAHQDTATPTITEELVPDVQQQAMETEEPPIDTSEQSHDITEESHDITGESRDTTVESHDLEPTAIDPVTSQEQTVNDVLPEENEPLIPEPSGTETVPTQDMAVGGDEISAPPSENATVAMGNGKVFDQPTPLETVVERKRDLNDHENEGVADTQTVVTNATQPGSLSTLVQDKEELEAGFVPEATPPFKPPADASELRRRPTVRQEPSEGDLLPTQTKLETTPSQDTPPAHVPQSRVQSSNVARRQSRSTGGWFSEWSVRDGLILLGVLAVSSVLVYAGGRYSGLWG